MTALSVNTVHKQFPGVKALNGVDLTIKQGEFFGLLGPNGAGKSTLINIIAGLARADSGDISIMGHDVVTDYRLARRSLGVVPQECVFDPFFTVRRSITNQAGYYGVGAEGKDWIDEIIESLALTDKVDTNMRALSGGMKRRVMIAQALAHKPPVIVLDEPTAGVDVELRRSLWEFIQRLHQQGHTIILTTHYLEEAEALCQRIGIINHGEIIALDSTENLIANGIASLSRLRVSLGNKDFRLNEKLQSLLSAQSEHELLFEFDRELYSVIDIVDLLRDSGAEIKDIHTEHADLEDVFISLTGNDKT